MALAERPNGMVVDDAVARAAALGVGEGVGDGDGWEAAGEPQAESRARTSQASRFTVASSVACGGGIR
jgi:hypothetical protein